MLEIFYVIYIIKYYVLRVVGKQDRLNEEQLSMIFYSTLYHIYYIYDIYYLFIRGGGLSRLKPEFMLPFEDAFGSLRRIKLIHSIKHGKWVK